MLRKLFYRIDDLLPGNPIRILMGTRDIRHLLETIFMAISEIFESLKERSN